MEPGGRGDGQPRATYHAVRNPAAPAGRAGVAVYVGITFSGKTTQAAQHARELIARTGWPVLVFDMEGSLPDSLTNGVVTESVDEAVTLLWGERCNVLFRPRGDGSYDRCEQLMRACRQAGHVILLVDGSTYLMTSRTAVDSPMFELLRGHRHAPAWLLATTHHFSGDIPQALLACSPHLFVFRTTQPAVLERLEKDYGLAPEAVTSLEQGECFQIFQGFPPRS